MMKLSGSSNVSRKEANLDKWLDRFVVMLCSEFSAYKRKEIRSSSNISTNERLTALTIVMKLKIKHFI